MTCHCFAPVLDVSVLWQGRNKTLWSTQYCGTMDSSVSTVTTLPARGQMHCRTIPARSKSSVLQSTKISHKAPSASYTMNIRGSFSGGKRSGCEPIHSPPTGDVRVSGALPPLSVLFDFLQKENFTFTQYQDILHWILYCREWEGCIFWWSWELHCW
jgi:hypothetical protein